MDKFNDYDKLLESYNNLEKEFTKKCQQLSQLKNTSGTSLDEPPQAQTLQDFLATFPEAQAYKEQLSQAVNNPQYSQSTDAYTRCYFDMLRQNYVSKEALAQDEDFLQQYVLSNNDVVSKLLQKVSPSVASTPTVISGNAGAMSVALPTRPKTIAEASKLAQQFFN
ncbi:MAG: hypothetical protein IKC47_04360 [Clostridia bacterium]|nr:hypothetical protein [Clostridia bacterium]